MTNTFYKFLNHDLTPCNGGSGVYPPLGEWTVPVSGELIPCKSGYHVVDSRHLLTWAGDTLHEVEVDGEIIPHGGDKYVVRRLRRTRTIHTWNERNLRLFAADCAERVLHLYEDQYPGDPRPREAISAARSYANGRIIPEQLAAAGDAVWDAARTAGLAAGLAAAGDAERQWQNERLWQYLRGEAADD